MAMDACEKARADGAAASIAHIHELEAKLKSAAAKHEEKLAELAASVESASSKSGHDGGGGNGGDGDGGDRHRGLTRLQRDIGSHFWLRCRLGI